MSKKYKKVCRVLNYIDHLLIVTSTITGCIFISVFSFVVGIPIGISSSTIGLKTCVIIAGIKKCKSMINKKKKKHDKILLLAKSKSKFKSKLMSKVLIDSNFSRDEFV